MRARCEAPSESASTGASLNTQANGLPQTSPSGLVTRTASIYRTQANGLPQASPGQARNERRPGSGNEELAMPQRGVTIFLRYAAIPRPRRPTRRHQSPFTCHSANALPALPSPRFRGFSHAFNVRSPVPARPMKLSIHAISTFPRHWFLANNKLAHAK